MPQSGGSTSTGPSTGANSGRNSGRSSTSNDTGVTSYTSSRRGSPNISPNTSLPQSLSPSFQESVRKHDTVDYRNYPTYDVQLVNPSEQLPRHYFVIRPVTVHSGCGPPVDNIISDKGKDAQLRSLGTSLLQRKTPLEIVGRMCLVTFKLSKDGFRKLRRMSIYIRDGNADVDLALELSKLLTVLSFPHLPSVKPHARFEGFNVMMNYGSIRLECPAYLDLIKFIPLLLENLPELQRITASEVHQLNLKGNDNRECFFLYKAVRSDLRELAKELEVGNFTAGELTGEYIHKGYRLGSQSSRLSSAPLASLPNSLDEKIRKLSQLEISQLQHPHPSSTSASGLSQTIFKENYQPTALVKKSGSKSAEAVPQVKKTMEPKQEDKDSDTASFVSAKDDNDS